MIHSCGPNFFYRTNSPTPFSLLAKNNSNPASPLTAFSGCFSRHDGLHIQEYLSCAVTNSINSPVFIFSTKAIPRRIPLTNTTLCFHLGWQLIKSQVQSQSEFSSSSKTSEPPRFVIISITFSQILEKPQSFSILRNNLQYCLDFSTVPVHKSIWMAKMH